MSSHIEKTHTTFYANGLVLSGYGWTFIYELFQSYVQFQYEILQKKTHDSCEPHIIKNSICRYSLYFYITWIIKNEQAITTISPYEYRTTKLYNYISSTECNTIDKFGSVIVHRKNISSFFNWRWLSVFCSYGIFQ